MTPQQTLTGQMFRTKSKSKPIKPGIPASLWDAIAQEPDRFVKDIYGNPRVTDYQSFVNELKNKLNNNNAAPYIFRDLDEELLRILFRSDSIKKTITRNVGEERAKEIYKVETESTTGNIVVPEELILTFAKPVQTRHYQRRIGTRVVEVREYKRGKPQKLTNVERVFFRNARTRKFKPKQTIYHYRMSFSQSNRSESSIKTHLYRAK